jgi:LPS-assembly lipoprotein
MWWSDRRVASALLALWVATAGACGFRLAGTEPLPDYLSDIRLVADDTRSDLYLALERRLRERGVALSDDSTNVLSLRDVATGQRVLSVSARNIPREYEVFYGVRFTFDRNDMALIESETLTLTRDYTWNENEVLGKAREEAMVRAAIVEDLVNAILRQIASLG